MINVDRQLPLARQTITYTHFDKNLRWNYGAPWPCFSTVAYRRHNHDRPNIYNDTLQPTPRLEISEHTSTRRTTSTSRSTFPTAIARDTLKWTFVTCRLEISIIPFKLNCRPIEGYEIGPQK